MKKIAPASPEAQQNLINLLCSSEEHNHALAFQIAGNRYEQYPDFWSFVRDVMEFYADLSNYELKKSPTVRKRKVPAFLVNSMLKPYTLFQEFKKLTVAKRIKEWDIVLELGTEYLTLGIEPAIRLDFLYKTHTISIAKPLRRKIQNLNAFRILPASLHTFRAVECFCLTDIEALSGKSFMILDLSRSAIKYLPPLQVCILDLTYCELLEVDSLQNVTFKPNGALDITGVKINEEVFLADFVERHRLAEISLVDTPIALDAQKLQHFRELVAHLPIEISS